MHTLIWLLALAGCVGETASVPKNDPLSRARELATGAGEFFSRQHSPSTIDVELGCDGRKVTLSTVPLDHIWVSPDCQWIVGLSQLVGFNPYQIVVYRGDGELVLAQEWQCLDEGSGCEVQPVEREPWYGPDPVIDITELGHRIEITLRAPSGEPRSVEFDLRSISAEAIAAIEEVKHLSSLACPKGKAHASYRNLSMVYLWCETHDGGRHGGFEQWAIGMDDDGLQRVRLAKRGFYAHDRRIETWTNYRPDGSIFSEEDYGQCEGFVPAQ